MTIKDQEAKKRMQNSVCVVGGHYEVGMLWKSDTPWLLGKTTGFKEKTQA